jgi:hypothetical protein
MSTLSVATISGVTTLTGGGFDQIGASANSANAAAIASMTTANLALAIANVANTTANATTLAMSTFVGTQNGQIIMTTNTATPFGGYLLCDGSVYNRSSYPNLANVANIAVLYGTQSASILSINKQGYNPFNTLSETNRGVFAATNNGILLHQAYNQTGYISGQRYVSYDNGVNWVYYNDRSQANGSPIVVLTSTYWTGAHTPFNTIAFNGTNYVMANAFVSSTGAATAAGIRYGSNVTTMNAIVTTGVSFVTTGIVYNGRDKFIAVGTPVASGSANLAAYSTDGITWTAGGGISNTGNPTTSGFYYWVGAKRLAYGNNAAVVGTANLVSQANSFYYPLIRYSQDNALTFSTATQPSGFGVNSPLPSAASNNTIMYLGYVNNQFLAIDGAGAIANSPNGVTWSLVAAANTLNNLMIPNDTVQGLAVNSLGYPIDYVQGFYVYGPAYSTDLVTWKRFPTQMMRIGYITPAGPGVTNPTTNTYFFKGGVMYETGDGGCGSAVPNFAHGNGTWNPYPFTGSQFSVPYLTDEVSGMVKYYIKT